MATFQVIESETGVVLASFDTQALAQMDVAVRTVAGARVFFKRAPDMQWRVRECARFLSGQYKPVIWSNEHWFINRDESLVCHYLHRATAHNLVAFTESNQKGEQDRQTVMKPGVYLTRFFSNVLTVHEIEHYARLHCMQPGKACDIKFAISAQDIQDIYERGPDSCMSGDVSDYEPKIHPVSVYGDSDLSLAYIEGESDYHDKEIKSRALVWAERKVYGRVYPTPERYSDSRREIARVEQNRLVQALESAGYRPGSFNGAKIRAIPHRRNEESYVMPYLDGGYSVDLVGEHFVLGKRASFEAQTTDGIIYLEARFTCDRCEESACPDDASSVRVARYSTESWCESCASNSSFYCHGDEETYSDEIESVSDSCGNNYSIYYASDNMFRCDNTGYWYDNSEAQDVYVRGIHVETWCRDAILEDAFCCYGTGVYYATRWHDSVEIDGETYLKTYAESEHALSTRLKEIEQAEEYENIAHINIYIGA